MHMEAVIEQPAKPRRWKQAAAVAGVAAAFGAGGYLVGTETHKAPSPQDPTAKVGVVVCDVATQRQNLINTTYAYTPSGKYVVYDPNQEGHGQHGLVHLEDGTGNMVDALVVNLQTNTNGVFTFHFKDGQVSDTTLTGMLSSTEHHKQCATTQFP